MMPSFLPSPVMKNEVLIAAELLQEGVFSLKEVNMPWLNQVDPE